MCVSSARKRGQFVGKLSRVEPAIPPRKFLVIDRLVEYPVVVKRCKEPAFDTGEQVADINEIVVAQRKDVGLITPIWCGC